MVINLHCSSSRDSSTLYYITITIRGWSEWEGHKLLSGLIQNSTWINNLHLILVLFYLSVSPPQSRIRGCSIGCPDKSMQITPEIGHCSKRRPSCPRGWLPLPYDDETFHFSRPLQNINQDKNWDWEESQPGSCHCIIYILINCWVGRKSKIIAVHCWPSECALHAL